MSTFSQIHAKSLVSLKLDTKLQFPPGVLHADREQQVRHVTPVATQIVEDSTLFDTPETDNHVYNYARILCHYGELIVEFGDAIEQGNGYCAYRCWPCYASAHSSFLMWPL